MFKLINLLMFILIGVVFRVQGNNNWCDIQKEHCQGKEHIGCTPNSFPVGTCTQAVLIPMTQPLINLILRSHNQHRNKTATGGLRHLPKASKMRQMYWDNDLAHLAKLHVEHCNFAHDQCRATNEFPHAGQNLETSASTAPDNNTESRLKLAVDSWFDENKDATAGHVDSLPSNINKIGHFTVMMRENNIRVGCAYLTYNAKSSGTLWYTHLVTCDYADNNFVGSPIYTRGEPCSQCKEIGSSRSANYSGLCA